MEKISVVVLTHNDEDKIVDCLETLAFADELIVIDDKSVDRTIDLCAQFTETIFVREMHGNFSNQRNYALNLVHNNWILFIDSDERVNKNLKNEILKAVKDKNTQGYFLKRVDFMWGRKILHGEGGSVKLLRLAKKGSGKWHGKVHEEWKIEGVVKDLKEPLIHIPHKSVREFINEVDEYSTLRALELKESGKKVNFLSIILYPVAKFLQNYFLRKGYKDKVPGFLYAMIMSFHSFLVRAKLYLYLKDKTHV
jgi:glycosyltransferase involved in cell wall biosynthesis